MRNVESELKVSPSAWAMVATGRNSRPPRNCAALFGPTSERSLTMITEVSCGAGFGGAGFAASFSEPKAAWATKRHKKHKKLKRGTLCFFVAVMLLLEVSGH